MNQQELQQIVDQVVAALKARGIAAGPSSTPAATPAPAATPEPQTEAPKTNARTAPPAPKKKQFITVDMLRKRAGFADVGPRKLELAPNEFLTPAAQDEARRLNLTVERKSKVVAAPLEPQRRPRREPSSRPASFSPPPIGLVLDTADPKVDGVLAMLGRQKVRFSHRSQSSCWMANLRSMCEAVAAGELRGGVAILSSAAGGLVLANKIAGVRAAAPASVDELAGVLQQFAANVMIVDPTARTFHEIRQLLAGFEPASAGADIGLMGLIGKLEGA